MNFTSFQGNAQDWDGMLLELKNEEFLQSYEWGDFQSKEGKPAIRICGTDESGKIKFLTQGFVHSLPFGMKYLYVPHNLPVQADFAHQFFVFLKGQGFLFVRFEPNQDFAVSEFSKIATHHRQYEYTSLLDLTQSQDDLLKSFHEKTRYNIRLAQKKGIVIKNEKNPKIFWPLLEETYKRDGIKSHSEKYYKDFISLENCVQLTAYFDGIPLASVLLYTFGKTCVYVHGASSNQQRNLMAPYLLQFEAMNVARMQGAQSYDLGGVARPLPKDNPNAETFHTYSWDKQDKLSGVTRFKAGFNGTIKHYGPAFDVAFSTLQYKLYSFVKKFL